MLSDLRSRKANAICVLQEGATLSIEETAKYDEVVEMHKLIATYRDEYANDLSRRLEVDKHRLPLSYTFMALLNPMFGLEPLITGSGLMNRTQHSHAREALLRSMQDEFDAKASVLLIPSDSGNSNSLDGTGTNNRGTTITLGYGPVKQYGADLPNGRSYRQYLDEKGWFDNLKFFDDHQDMFLTLNVVVQHDVSRRVVEPRCNTLGVPNYECIAMLAHMLSNIHIDPEWVAQEYLRRNKAKTWKIQSADDSLKYFNLERILDAEAVGNPKPKEVSMADFLEGIYDIW
ncbi:hypothetical protein ACHAW6_003558 [Cyclotella cf. meneghiniana]